MMRITDRSFCVVTILGCAKFSMAGKYLEIPTQVKSPEISRALRRTIRSSHRSSSTTFLYLKTLINQLGYQSLFADRSDEAIAIFKTNVERYPDSANVYDSLAEAYERAGKLELAAPLYEKAQTLGQQNQDPNLAVYKANFERVSEKLKQAGATKKNQ